MKARPDLPPAKLLWVKKHPAKPLSAKQRPASLSSPRVLPPFPLSSPIPFPHTSSRSLVQESG